MTKILGKSIAIAEQMEIYLLSVNKKPLFSRQISVLDFCKLYIDICAKENVRGDIAFAQACKETNYFSFTGDVDFAQNNFAGLGATGGGEKGCVFATIEEGILAQAQHLKSYATRDELNEPCVDPRRTRWFMMAKGGSSPDVESLAGTWAIPGYELRKYSSLEAANNAKDSYGYQIINILNRILKVSISNTNENKKEETNMAVSNGILIAIDAGHGSNTAGKRTPDGYREHWVNVKCANYFDIAMKRCGFKTLKVAWDDTDATDDTDVALGTRQKQIKAAGCKASVSWHANAHGDGKTYTTAQGIETLIHSASNKVKDSKKLADNVHKYLIQGTKQTNRGVKSQSLAMCNCAVMGTQASILIEVGFMTNSYEKELIKTDAFCLECAEEAAKGVCEYFGVAYIASGTNTPAIPAKVEIPLKITQSKLSIQKFLNTYYGDDIKGVLGNKLKEDGAIGTQSKRALGIAFQVELNKLGAKLSVDGYIGNNSAVAFDKYVKILKSGSKGIFVTLWQCILVGHNLDPNGIDGSFGNGCVAATNSLFYKIGITRDGNVTGSDLNALL